MYQPFDGMLLPRGASLRKLCAYPSLGDTVSCSIDCMRLHFFDRVRTAPRLSRAGCRLTELLEEIHNEIWRECLDLGGAADHRQ